MRPEFELGVLDLTKRSDRLSAQQSLAETLELASYVESLGYRRYWVAEHHTDDAAQSSPEVLLPLLASRTSQMRIGAAAILLRYYAPLKVAEVFLALEALFPGRIELGVARGPGVTSKENAVALVDGSEDWLIDSRYLPRFPISTSTCMGAALSTRASLPFAPTPWVCRRRRSGLWDREAIPSEPRSSTVLVWHSRCFSRIPTAMAPDFSNAIEKNSFLLQLFPRHGWCWLFPQSVPRAPGSLTS